jgi:hypothetical protein
MSLLIPNELSGVRCATNPIILVYPLTFLQSQGVDDHEQETGVAFQRAVFAASQLR